MKRLLVILLSSLPLTAPPLHPRRPPRTATEPEGNRLLVFDAKTKALAKAIAIAGTPVSLAVDHASKHAYVATASTGEVLVIDLATLTITDRIPTVGHPDGMALAE